jgi:uncharacterized LabA/DUF88 family protein
MPSQTPPEKQSSPIPQPERRLSEPSEKRAIVFFDGQNLFHTVAEVFGYQEPDYDPVALAARICKDKNWQIREVRFYTGLPGATEDPFWHRYWSSKLRGLRSAKVQVFTRPLRYRGTSIRYGKGSKARFYLPDGTALLPGTKLYLPDGKELPDGTQVGVTVGEEKGIDVRIALDIIHLAHTNVYDVAVIFSQDQDLAEVVDEIRWIAREQGRWIKIASAFPWIEKSPNPRGIERTDWIRIDQDTYDACRDPRDYKSRR